MSTSIPAAPLSPTRARSLAAALLAHVGVFKRAKASSPEMRAIAEVFRYAPLLGQHGYPTPDDFLLRYVTTIGPVMYMTDDAEALADTNPVAYVALHAHEATHGVQWYREPVTFPGRYLGLVLNAQGGEKEPRALYEAEAEVAALEAVYLLTGRLPSSALELARRFSAGYGFGDAETLYQSAVFTAAVTSVASGLITTKAGQFLRGAL